MEERARIERLRQASEDVAVVPRDLAAMQERIELLRDAVAPAHSRARGLAPWPVGVPGEPSACAMARRRHRPVMALS